jgi:hypothetical protein
MLKESAEPAMKNNYFLLISFDDRDFNYYFILELKTDDYEIAEILSFAFELELFNYFFQNVTIEIVNDTNRLNKEKTEMKNADDIIDLLIYLIDIEFFGDASLSLNERILRKAESIIKSTDFADTETFKIAESKSIIKIKARRKSIVLSELLPNVKKEKIEIKLPANIFIPVKSDLFFESLLCKKIPKTKYKFITHIPNTSSKSQEHVHIYDAKNNEIISINRDGTAHHGHHGEKISKKIAKELIKKGYKIRADNIIEAINYEEIAKNKFYFLLDLDYLIKH